MTDTERLRKFMQTHGASREDVATLWGAAADDVSAVLSGEAEMAGRHRALLVLFGSAHKTARASALQHLRLDAGEVWRPIPGFVKYEASTLGRVRRAAGGSGASSLRVLKLTPRPDGYLRVTLYSDDGAMQTKQVHRVVCLAFHGPAEGRQSCHRDGDHLNNAESNLYWGTALDNARDRLAHEAADPLRALRKIRKVGGIAGSRLGKSSVRRLFRDGFINKDKALALLGR